MIAVPDLILSNMAEKFGTCKDSLAFLGGGREDSDGIIYSYRQNSKDMVLKVLAFKHEEKENALNRIEERIKFIHFLGNNGVDIVYPVFNVNNNLYETIDGDNHVFLGYTMYRIDGTHPTMEEHTPEFYVNFGKTIGRLHRTTKQYHLWKGSGQEGDCNVLGWQEEWNGFYNWCKDEDVKECWITLKNELSKLPLTRDTHGFIHNDPHTNNILMNGSNITLIDFDCANFQWFATDIPVAAQSVLFSQSGGMNRPISEIKPLEIFFNNFMRGYETENHLDDLFIKKMDLFLHYRRMLLFIVMQDWLNTKPKMKDSWKNMIMDSPQVMGRLL